MTTATTSPLYSLFIFNKSGVCMYHHDYLRGKPEDEDEQKLLFGMLFSMRRFVQRTSPAAEDDGSFHHYTCSQYRLYFYRCPTGAIFCALTEPKYDSLQEELLKIYGIYVETCIRNPLYELHGKITCSLFRDQLDEFLRAQKLIA